MDYLYYMNVKRHTAIERLKDETMNDRKDKGIVFIFFFFFLI